MNENMQPIATLGGVYVTPERVRQGVGKRFMKSALLCEVDAAELLYVRYDWLLIAAAIVLAAGGVLYGLVPNKNLVFFLGGIGLAGVLALVYIFSRQVAVFIHAGTMTIRQIIPGSRAMMDRAVAFIDLLEAAKLEADTRARR